ncbi:MAG: molecular chaperone DnaJ [Armatimonadetes bacterium]|nr:molecular chaperone DnaJ [Armatimonadota bacterium]
MPDKPDYYDVLGVPRDADAAAVKKAFRKLAREHHPDVNPGDPQAAERFKQLGEAYAVLGDAEKRSYYDRYGHAPENGLGAGDFNADMFGDLAGVFQSFFNFGGMGGFGQQPQRRGPRPGDSLVLGIQISLEEVVSGVEQEISYRRQTTCPECFGVGAAEGSSPERCTVCEGHGQVRQQRRTIFGLTTVVTACPECAGEGQVIRRPCPRCQGQGRIQDAIERTVKIPPGVEDGMRVKVPGGGDAGVQGGPDGDLYLQVRIRPHSVFAREGMDIHCEQRITFAQAALGDTITVPGLVEDQKLVIPAGTQTGTTFRIGAAGLPSARSNYGRGDQYVTVTVVTPTNLTADQKELLFRFAHACGEQDLEPEEKGFFERLLDALKRK